MTAARPTTTVHRPGCPRSGWFEETYPGVIVARCLDCAAVELREPTTTDEQEASG